MCKHTGLGYVRVRSPLLAESLLFSVPLGTEMVHFPRLPSLTLWIQVRIPAHERGWVAPFGEVAAYLRAQKILAKAQPETTNGETRFTWDMPAPFPHGVVLKVRIDGSIRSRLYQSGHELHPSKHGVYEVSFDSRELVVRGKS